MGKRTAMSEFFPQNRGGKGVKCYKITEKTGNVVGVKAVNDDNEVMLITTEGIIIRISCSDISILGRITSGVKLMNLDENVVIASVAKVREKKNKNNVVELPVAEEIQEESDEEETSVSEVISLDDDDLDEDKISATEEFLMQEELEEAEEEADSEEE
jgi:DNA gyrase subunit A